jgi:uncharacterized Zn finger protein
VEHEQRALCSAVVLSTCPQYGGFVYVLKLEKWPDGEGRRIKEIGRVVIEAEKLEDGRTVFHVALAHRGRSDVKKILESPARRGLVDGQRRLANNIWTLVAKSLRSIGFRYTDEGFEEAEEVIESEEIE